MREGGERERERERELGEESSDQIVRGGQ